MAGNDWINSFLETTLDAELGINNAHKASLLLRERGRFNPTRYLVEEVTTGFDETELHKTWVRAAMMRSPQERNTRLENMCWRTWNLAQKKKQVTEVISFQLEGIECKVAISAAMRSPQERNTRQENMCWRIWNLTQKKKQIEGEEAQRVSERLLEHERGPRDATADMSEDHSEGEKGDAVSHISAHGDSTRDRMPRIGSIGDIEAWESQHKDKKLYIVLISIHGLIRGENMELGRDSDTGGQAKYVVELARALGAMPAVYRVDLLTRLILAPDVDWSYGEPTEMLAPTNLNHPAHDMGESSGAYIIRIPCGPRDKYIPKELLWPYIQEFVDGALTHIMQMSEVLGEQISGGQPVLPVAIHGHYADAGDSAALLSGALNVPMLFTGHSLGRDKLEQLQRQVRQTREEIDAAYKMMRTIEAEELALDSSELVDSTHKMMRRIEAEELALDSSELVITSSMRRIEAEELALDASELVITSTRQEIDEQWQLYDGFDVTLERKLRARIKRGVSCYGRFMPRMFIIPPGMKFNHFVVHEGDIDGDREANEDNPASPDPPIWSEIMRFFSNPRKPMILALARPDPKKNLITLVKAFGECHPLRELANLTLLMANREAIDETSGTSAAVLNSVLKMIDKYDLYGQVAYPKHHKQVDVPDIYRLTAKTKGVFINPALIEPFGLTLIEAAAHGLPIVATTNGGSVDIHRVLDNGLLVDPHDQCGIATALLNLVADKQLWARCWQNGLKNIHLFSWPEHCKTYLSRIASFRSRHHQWRKIEDWSEESEPESPDDSLRDISLSLRDISLSLEGEKESGTLDKKRLESAFLKLPKIVERASNEGGSNERTEQGNNPNKLRMLRRRKYIVVIAVDSDTGAALAESIKNIFEATHVDRTSGSVGFVLSTGLTIREVHSVLVSGGFLATDFDAFVCNSGSELFYPTSNPEEMLSTNEIHFVVDEYYHSQIEYRWGGEGLRKTLVRWAASIIEKKEESEEQVVIEEEKGSSAYCHAFKVKNAELVPSVKELRKIMRIQALHCHVIYSHDGTRLNVIPVLASRSQALRYFKVRWGAELSNMVVFVGESGDTDYEGLLGGLHKTIILKGTCSTTNSQLHGRSYSLQDVVAFDSPNIVRTESGSSVKDIQLALQQLDVLKK